MAGETITLVDLLMEVMREWRKYYENPMDYLKKIKSIVRKHDPEAQIILFGSIVKGSLRPDSDIDVLIITKLASNIYERLKLRIDIAKEIGDSTPFEIHIITPEEYNKWYKKFIDKHIPI